MNFLAEHWSKMLTFLVVGLVVSGLACSGRQQVDEEKKLKDPGKQFAPRASAGFIIEDDIDAQYHKIVIWRYFDTDKPGKLVLNFKLERADVQGKLSVVNSRGQTLETVPLVKGQRMYRVAVNLRGNKKYFIRIYATEGKTKFYMKPIYTPRKTVVVKPKTGCENCTSLQACFNGQCVRPKKSMRTHDCPNKCSRGYFCVARKCWRECFGDCGSGSWCNPLENKCESDPCVRKRCKKNYVCNRIRGGVCIRRGKVIKPKVKKVCNPPCGPGRSCYTGKCYTPPEIRKIKAKLAQKKCKKKRCKKGMVCQAGKCVKKGSAPKLTGSRVSSKVVSSIVSGSGLILILNKGSEHGVKKGAKCSVKGGSCRVFAVFAYRCKAKTSANDVKTGTRVSIQK